MMQTFIMFAAAVQLIAVACAINAHTFWATIIYQFGPITLALGLGIFGFARIMGWPI
jgi:hypothetical protein